MSWSRKPRRPVPKPGGAIGRTFDQFLQAEKWKEIVRELAEWPLLRDFGGGFFECVCCDWETDSDDNPYDYDSMLAYAQTHRPACLWRRAVELVEGE